MADTTDAGGAEVALAVNPPARSVSADGDAGAAAPLPPPAASPLPEGTTILHIGDSFAAALGIELNKALKERGVKGVLRYKTASFIPEWAWSKELPIWLLHHNPDLVLITLGANELAIKDPEQRAKLIQKLVGRLEGRPCIWVAVPLWKPEHNGLLEVIQRNIAPCGYMDSNVLFPDMPRVDDGIHPSMNARVEWAKLVVDWLARARDPAGQRPWDLRPHAFSPATKPLADLAPDAGANP